MEDRIAALAASPPPRGRSPENQARDGSGGSKLMSHPFTDQWELAMRTAAKAAADLGHTALSPDHLLLALVEMGDTCAAEAAMAVGVTVDAIRCEIASRQSADDSSVDAVIASGVAISRALDHNFLGTDHLLLALSAQVSVPPTVSAERIYAQWRQTPLDQDCAAVSHYLRGLVWRVHGRSAKASAALQHALSAYKASHARRTAYVEFNLALVSLADDNHVQAAAYLRSCVSSFERPSDLLADDGAEYVAAHARYYMARIAQLSGARAISEQGYEHALATYVWQGGSDGYLARTAERLGELAASSGHYERAIELVRAAARARSTDALEVNVAGESDRVDQLVVLYDDGIRARFRGAGSWDSFRAGSEALRSAAECHSSRQFAEGIAAAKSALRLMQAAGHPKYIADARYWMALCTAGADGTIANAVDLLRTAYGTYLEHKLFAAATQAATALGDLRSAAQSWTLAHGHYSSAYAAALRSGDRAAAAHAAVLSARMLTKTGQHADARVELDCAYRLYSNCSDLRRGDTAMERARAVAATDASYEAVTASYVAADEVCASIGDLVAAVRANIELAVQATRRGRFDDAYALSEMVVNRVETALPRAEMMELALNVSAYVLRSRAEQRLESGDHTGAANDNLEAVARSTRAGSDTDVALGFGAAGSAYLLARDFDSASKYYRLKLDRCDAVLTDLDRAQTLSNLGVALQCGGRADEARSALEESRSLFISIGKPSLAADVDHSLRAVDGIAESNRLGDPDLVAQAAQDLAAALTALQAGDAARAGSAAQRAYDVYSAAARWNDAAQAVVYLASAERDLGHWQQALDRITQFVDARRPLLGGRSLARLELVAGTVHFEMRNVEEAREYLTTALSGFEDHRLYVESANCQRELAMLAQSVGDDDGAARFFATRVKSLRNVKGADRELAEALLESAQAQLKAGRYTDVAVALDEAERLASQEQDPSCLAGCTMMRAMVDLELGERAKAQKQFDRAEAMFRSAGKLDAAMAVQTIRETAMIKSGNAERAVEVLTANLAGLEGRTDVLQRRSAAQTQYNLASAELDLGHVDVARQHLNNARKRFEALGDTASIDDCEILRGNIEYKADNFALAAAILTSVLPRLDEADNDPKLAQTLLHAANACRRSQRWSEAVEYFADARDIYYRLGKINEVAECDLNAARLMGSQGNAHRTVLDRLLPAAIFIDAQRLQFPRAAQRVRWKGQVNAAFQQALETCYRAGDAALSSEIIEFVINSGVYAAGSPADEETAPFHDHLTVTQLAVLGADEEAAERNSALTMDGGAARLLAGAELPMTAPPRLIRPNGKMILSPFVESADFKYATIDRPGAVPIA